MRGQIARIKKSCRRCERMVQEPAPSRPIPGGMAGPNLLAQVLVSKFDVHLPLYRQHEIFARMGADIPESTLVGWCGRAMKTLSPLIERIEAEIMSSDLLHADDTPIRVLDRSLRDKGLGKGVRQGRIWAYVRDPLAGRACLHAREATPMGWLSATRCCLSVCTGLEGRACPDPSGQRPRHPASGRLQGLCQALRA